MATTIAFALITAISMSVTLKGHCRIVLHISGAQANRNLLSEEIWKKYISTNTLFHKNLLLTLRPYPTLQVTTQLSYNLVPLLLNFFFTKHSHICDKRTLFKDGNR